MLIKYQSANNNFLVIECSVCFKVNVQIQQIHLIAHYDFRGFEDNRVRMTVSSTY